ncbi:MAG: transposase [bacterium]
MTRFSSEFKLQCVKKALSRSHTQTQRNIAEDIGVGYSTLQRWVRLAKDNKLEKLESPMTLK